MQNWDDLRFLLAVHTSGTMTAAAARLGTNVATVSRRLERLADSLGAPPFVKTPDGWQASAAILPLIRAAESFEGWIATELNRRSSDQPQTMTQISLGCPPLIAGQVLFPGLVRDPAVLNRIELSIAQRIFGEGLGEFDIVIRQGRPSSGRLMARKVGDIGFDLYGWPDTTPNTRWIGVVKEHEPFKPLAWAYDHFNSEPMVRVETFEQVARLSRDMRLPAVLPTDMARAIPDLVRLRPEEQPFRTDFWVTYHQSRRGDPSLQIVCDWIADCFRALSAADGGG